MVVALGSPINLSSQPQYTLRQHAVALQCHCALPSNSAGACTGLLQSEQQLPAVTPHHSTQQQDHRRSLLEVHAHAAVIRNLHSGSIATNSTSTRSRMRINSWMVHVARVPQTPLKAHPAAHARIDSYCTLMHAVQSCGTTRSAEL
jgi:hypothetical protein